MNAYPPLKTHTLLTRSLKKPARLPRYTSYPTALEFGPLAEDLYAIWLKALPKDEAVSLYFHIPFCKQLCWFCGCFTKISNKYEAVEKYLDVLSEEIRLVSTLIGPKKVSHIHFGGGSPTMIEPDDFIELMEVVRENFDLEDVLEVAVEIDPRTCTQDKVAAYARAGVNRVSLGIQDFNYTVQHAINRVQSESLVAENLRWFHASGIKNINFDLIYGLPGQTLGTIYETVETSLIYRPSRIALFGYAHVPERAKHQNMMEGYMLPDAHNRQAMFELASHKLQDAGYQAIGLDHFSLPGDSLLAAQKSGTLKRNFQGYTADQADHMIGIGASAISNLPAGYAQNSPDLKTYAAQIKAGKFAARRGLAVDGEDILIREIIATLMCCFEVDPQAIARAHGSEKLFGQEMDQLQQLVRAGYMVQDRGLFRITAPGRPFLRAIATLFDQNFPQDTHIIERCIHESEG